MIKKLYLTLFQAKMAFLLMLLGSSFTILAQDIKVSGIIRDENGDGVPGATVLIKGTNSGTATDVNGYYSLTAPASGMLTVSYIGYQSMDISINGQSTLDIAITPAASALDEVVVIGYGSQKKRDVTGSVTSVSEVTLKEVPAPNMLSQLKGRAAGVSIVSNGSTPGSQGSIRIRGNRTLTTGNGDGLDGPLVVVDGIPYGGLNDINPDDIASMEILKDASATAIYGSRGAGGVILITTKRGKVGKPVLTYDGYHGITNVLAKYHVMNGQEYAQFNKTQPNTTRSLQGLHPTR